MIVALGLATWSRAGALEPVPGTLPATGTNRASVAVVYDPAATEAFSANRAVVRKMVESGLMALTGKSTTDEAWRTLVLKNDIVGFKVTSGPGPVSGTRTSVVRALVESLIQSGFSPDRIIIWDKRMADLRNGGWPGLATDLGIRCEGSEESDWDPTKFYESPMPARLIAGDLEFGLKLKDGVGRRSHVTKLLTQKISKIISVAPVLSHNFTGVNGHLTGLALGSVDNSLRFAGEPDRLAEVIPEICALDDLMPKVLLGVSDALICQYRGEETTLLHYAKALNELRFSRDLVALDSLAMADVESARAEQRSGTEKPRLTDLYANAELIEMGVANRDRIDIHRIP
jgi:hypothetical protein